MAGRILVIEFDDATTADAVRAQIDKATRRGKHFRSIGYFSRPNPPYCTCGSRKVSERGKPAETKWSRKYGFRICTKCNRYVAELYGLKNLIAEDEIIDAPKHEWKYQGRLLRGIFYMSTFIAMPKVRD